jgi:hypothetical protein
MLNITESGMHTSYKNSRTYTNESKTKPLREIWIRGEIIFGIKANHASNCKMYCALEVEFADFVKSAN